MTTTCDLAELLPAHWTTGAPVAPPFPHLRHVLGAALRASPDAPALVVRREDGSSRRWSYRELDADVRRRAAALRRAGVGAGDAVVLVAARTPGLVPTVLAVLSVGAAYVPVDPTAPVGRVRAVARLAGARALAGPAAAVERAAEHLTDVLGDDAVLVDVDADLDPDPDLDGAPSSAGEALPAADPASTAYVLFTSGSTGEPKGVVVTHANVVHRLPAYLGMTSGPCRYLLHSSLSFDGAVGGMYSTLARGGCLVLVPDAVAGDPALAAAVVREESVTHLEPVPSWCAALLELAEPGDLASVRAVVLGGEVVPPELVAAAQRALPEAVLVDDYGPTEVTVAATAFVVPRDWAGGALPIGRPHPATAVAVLDDAGAPVPDGEVGELWVAGPCVAAGYLGRPQDPAFGLVPGTDVPRYRTGDLVRWREDGQLAFCGRRDRQVKVRGQRVEPEEVEAVLGGLPGVAAAAVEVDGSGEAARLVAYAAPVPGVALTADAVAAALAERLPTHLRPGAVVVLEALPLTPGGKVDRRALPAPDRGAEPGEAPRDDLERAVADAMAAVLGVPVHRSTDFHRAGGQSLAAARVAARVRSTTGRPVTPGDLAGAGTPAELAERLRGRAPVTAPARSAGAQRGAASARQESFWFLEHAPGGVGRSNLVEVLLAPPGTSPAVLRAAAQALVDRHPALRTRFELGAEGLGQVVEPRVELAVEDLDLAHEGPMGERGGDEQALLAAADRWGARPFDLGRAPLLAAAVAATPRGPALVLAVHHAVADGWSLELLVEEVDALVRSGGDASALPAPSPLTPVDVAAPEVDRPADEREAASAALAEVLRRGAAAGPRALPFDGPGSAEVSQPGVVARLLPADLVDGARELAAAAGTTTFTVLAASLGTLLARTGDQPEVLLGTPTSGRGAVELDRLVGCLIGTGLVPVDVSGDPSFREVVRRTSTSAAAAAEHAWLPLEVPLRSLAEGERAAAVPVLLNLLEAPQGLAPDRLVERRSRPGAMAYAELDLYLQHRDGGLAVEAVHRDRLSSRTVETLLDRWERLLRRAVADPDSPAAELPLTTAEEDRALADLERDPAAPPAGLLLQQVRAQLEQDPRAVAVRDGDGSWSRAALWARAGSFAALLAARGTRPGDRVVLALDGCADAVAALVGCWRAGAVVVPVGEEQPPARLRRLVAACAASAVLDRDVLDEVDELDDAAAPDVEPAPQDPAYVLFTSGTTGEPKGVVVGHAALAASTRARLHAYPQRPRTALVAHDLAFDAALGIIAWYLWTGGELVLAERTDRLDPARLAALVLRHGVGQLDVVPSHHRLLLDLAEPEDLASLELVTLGGEACTPSLVRAHREVLPGTALVNEYGPTESTVWSLAHTCRAEDGEGVRVPVGRPVLGVVARVADAQGRRRPPGAEGELLLGGHLLADGYLDDPARTAERFVVRDERRWYRTGDRVRTRADGVLEFLGRDDAQVKVRGFRVELEEVDAALTALPAVTRGVAGVLELVQGEPVLVGWVQPVAGHEPDVEHLRDALLSQLPEWAVPGVLVVVDQLPETTAGKVDRVRLPRPSPPSGGAPPTTPTEHLVVAVWEELLGRPVGVDRTFTALGGQSLLAARMVARLRAETGLDVDLRDVLAAPRARDVASLLDRLDPERTGGPVGSPPTGAPADPAAEPSGGAPAPKTSDGSGDLGVDDVEELLSRLDELDDDEVARLLARVEDR